MEDLEKMTKKDLLKKCKELNYPFKFANHQINKAQLLAMAQAGKFPNTIFYEESTTEEEQPKEPEQPAESTTDVSEDPVDAPEQEEQVEEISAEQLIYEGFDIIIPEYATEVYGGRFKGQRCLKGFTVTQETKIDKTVYGCKIDDKIYGVRLHSSDHHNNTKTYLIEFPKET